MKKRDTRKELIDALESLPEYQITLVLAYIKSLRAILAEQEKKLRKEAFMAYLHGVPEDDEELTPEDLAAIEEGEKAFREGRTQPWEEVRQELGI
ncbi:MAG: hypothetical protein RDV48_20540 [Candidatus Eremiobacteraeota bacterium]|nr:hypothetical protein [Candidatus Eremiobacteraeota bacterium]